MNKERNEMDASLKSIVVPHLRSIGFKGSFPHFYRKLNNNINLLTFQFKLSGGSFIVEISNIGPDKENLSVYKNTPINKLRVSQTSNRLRLGSNEENKDHWYSFTKSSFLTKKPNLLKISNKVIEHINKQGEKWWESQNLHRS